MPSKKYGGSKTAHPRRRAAAMRAKSKVTEYDLEQDRKIRTLQKKVKGEEVKYTDTGIAGGAGAAMTTTGTVVAINFNAQGNQPFNRTANQFKNIWVDIRGYITYNNSNLQQNLVRLMLFWDKNPSGANPTLFGSTVAGSTAVFDNTSTTGLIPDMFAIRSHETMARFQILYDKKFALPMPATNLMLTNRIFRIRKNLKGKVTKFINTTSAVTSLFTNGLFFAWIFDNNHGTAPIINFNSRVAYTDD